MHSRLTDEIAENEQEPTFEREKEKTSKSVTLFNLLVDWEINVFRDEDTDDIFCCYPNSGYYQVTRLFGGAFLAWSVCKFFEATGKTISSTLVRETLLLLQAKCEGTRKTFVRVGAHSGNIYLDLCNEAFEVVEIDKEGWRVVQDSPVMFRRGRYARPLPRPKQNGSLESLRSLVNFATQDDYILTIAWLVAAMNPSGPFPILALSSEHGSGKSTLTTILQRLLDPQTTERLAPLKDADALFSSASGRWIVPLDNCGRINAEMSDHFCRLATGGGYEKRALYTDNDSYSVSVTRPLVLNGIALSLGRMDLLDRAFCVNLRPILEMERKTEERIYRNFESIQPLLVGALCTAASAALREREYKPRDLPRMADGAAFVMRAEKGGGLPWQPGTFAATLANRDGLKIETALLDDPVGAALLYIIQRNDSYSGTASNLLHNIKQVTHADEWQYLPKLPRSLSKRIEELTPFLRAKGIEIRRDRSNGERLLKLNKIESA